MFGTYLIHLETRLNITYKLYYFIVLNLKVLFKGIFLYLHKKIDTIKHNVCVIYLI